MNQSVEPEEVRDIEANGEFKEQDLELRRSKSTLDDVLEAEASISSPEIGEGSPPEKTNDPGPPPDGGFAAWTQVAGSFFLFFNCW